MYDKLEKTISKSISLIRKADSLDVEPLHKPLAGRERSLFPIVMAAAWQSGFVVSPEAKVVRESTQTAGAVDAVFFDTAIEQDFVVEAKIATCRTQKNDITKINDQLLAAKKQLVDVKKTKSGLSRKYGLVSCIIFKVIYRANSEAEANMKHEEHSKERLKLLEEHFAVSERFFYRDVCFAGVHQSHSNKSITKGKSATHYWCGGIAIIMEMVRKPTA